MFKTFPFQHQIAICYMYTYIYMYAIDVIYIYAIDVISPITISFLKQSCHIKHISGGSGSRRAGHEVASLKLFCWPNLSWTLTILQTSTISKKISGAMHWPCINEIQIWSTIYKIQSMHGNQTSWKYTWRSNRFFGRVHRRSTSDRDSATSAFSRVEIEGAQFGNPPGTRWWNFGQWRWKMINRLVVPNIFSFSSLFGEDSQVDEHIFQMGLVQPPTSSTCLLFYKVLDRMDSNGIQPNKKKQDVHNKPLEGGRFLPKLFSVLGKRIFGGWKRPVLVGG